MGALKIYSSKDCNSIEDIKNQASSVIKKIYDLIEENNDSYCSNEDITKGEEFKDLGNCFNIALCLVELSSKGAEEVTQNICDELSKIQAINPNIEKWLKKQLLFAYELHCRAKFKTTFWQPLLDRKDINSTDTQLGEAERYSVLYENLIRETTETSDSNAKRRSTALTIRARALYLRGYFSQAHHFLDLSTIGLFTESIAHWSLLGITHVVRAELLTFSADQHYFSLPEYDQVRLALKRQDKEVIDDIDDKYKNFFNFSKKVQPITEASLKKIKRAEHELTQAEKIFQNIAHQNIWLIHLEFGWAQIKIEKILFEMELLFLSWISLDVTEYLKKSGELEQEILDTMKRIRNVFDLIPYQSRPWDKAKKGEINEVEAGRSMFNIECNTLKLWRQLFVVGTYYSRLLRCLYIKDADANLKCDGETTIDAAMGMYIPSLIKKDKTKYLEQWKSWCIAMRFDSFADIDYKTSFDQLNSINTNRSLKSISLRAGVIDIMIKESEPNKVKEMWNIRRKNETG